MTADRIRQAIAEEFGEPLHRLADDAEFYTDLGLDSIDHVHLVVALEDTFGIEIPDSAAEEFKTVGDVVRWFERRREHADA
jgi:acyl carrier protein